MITGLYSASADSIPILCITGQAPRARLYKEDFQAVDIESIAKPVTKWAVTVREPAQVPRAFQQAFHLMRSGRPGPVLIDLPFDVQMAEIEFDIDTYEPLPVYKPRRHAQRRSRRRSTMLNDARAAADRRRRRHHQRRRVATCCVEFAEITGVPVIPTLMGWGTIPDDHPLMAGMCGLQTAHRYGNATMLASDFVLGIGNRWANRHTGSVEVYTKGRKFVHVDIEPTQIGRVFAPDLGIVSDAKAALELFVEVAREWKAAGKLQGPRRAGSRECRERKRTMLRKTQLRQRADEAAARLPGDEQGVRRATPLRHARSACRRSPARSSCTSTSRATGSTAARPARSAGRSRRRSACAPPIPTRKIVALSGDYDFQFMIEELAVGAQFKLPYIHVVVNNSYLGLIRQAQRGFEMDFYVQLALRQHQRAASSSGYGVDHVKVAEGLGCKAIRVHKPEEIDAGDPAGASSWMARVQGAGRGRVHPRARHQHLDGHRDRQRSTSSRSSPTAHGRRADRDRAARLTTAHDAEPEHDRCRKFAANLTMLFNEVDVPRPLRRRRQAPASRASNILFPYAYPTEELAERLDAQRPRAGAVQPAGRRLGRAASAASPAMPDRVDEFRDGVGKAIDYAQALGCQQVNCLAGIAPQGVDRDEAARDASSTTCASPRASSARRGHQAADRADQHLRHSGLLSEPHARRRSTIIDEVGSDNLFLQYDIYHMQLMEGELAATIEANLARIAHIQLADNPGRNEPGTGEINYPFLFGTSTRSATPAGSAASTSRAATTAAGLGWLARARADAPH